MMCGSVPSIPNHRHDALLIEIWSLPTRTSSTLSPSGRRWSVTSNSNGAKKPVCPLT